VTLSTVDSQAFPVVAKTWNALLDSIVSTSSVDSFHHELKTLLGYSDRSGVST